MQTDRYPFILQYSTDDDGWIATAVDLPGCSAAGWPMHKAIFELQHAITAWIEAQTKAGNPIPPPTLPAADRYVPGRALQNDIKRLVAENERLRAELAAERDASKVGSLTIFKGPATGNRYCVSFDFSPGQIVVAELDEMFINARKIVEETLQISPR